MLRTLIVYGEYPRNLNIWLKENLNFFRNNSSDFFQDCHKMAFSNVYTLRQ